jgi:eukaryotic-like serine/threonine-protein kinase
MSSERALNAFLRQYLDDQASGAPRSLTEYQVLFPGHETLIADRYAQYEGGRADDAPSADDIVDGRVGPYRLLKELGRGGQGVVYLAEDERLRRKVALKVLTGLGSLTADRVARFLREAEVASRLEHPGVAAVYEVGASAGAPYLAMRYVEGGTLAARIAAAPRDDDQAGARAGFVRVAEKAARALHAAHEAGVVHRDIKPGNILLTPAGDPVVVDFGLAHDADEELATLTQSGDFFGTPAYMAPEQIGARRTSADRRTDVWSLGATLYECLAGRRPFEAPTRERLYRRILTEEPDDLRRIDPSIPADLAAVVETALQKDPDRRYRTAAAMADDLAAFAEGRPVAARRVGAVGSLVRWARREPAKALLIAALLIAAASAVVLLTLHVAGRDDAEAARLAKLQDAKDDELSQASCEIGEGDPERAVASFERAMNMEGGSAEAVAGLALAHLTLKRPMKALEVLDAHRARTGHLRAAVLLRASALRSLGRIAEADALERSAAAPKDALDFYLDGESLLQRGHGGGKPAFQEALQAFRNAIYLAPAPRAVYFQQAAHAARHAGDEVSARELAAALRRHWPSSPNSLFWIAYALGPDAPEESLDTLRQAIRMKPTFRLAYYNLGVTLGGLGRFDEAAAAYREALRSKPDDPSVLFNLGAVSGKMGFLDDAVDAYRAALKARPSYAAAHYHLGNTLKQKGLADEALSSYRDGVAADPDDPVARFNLGTALEEKGLVDEAITELRAAVALRSDYATAHCNLGAALRDRGLTDAAVASFREALRLDPDLIVAHRGLTRLLRKLGRHADVVVAAREAIRVKPDDAEFHHRLGLALHDLGQFDAATASFADAIRRDADFADAHFELGRTLVKTGRLPEGLTSLRRGHELGAGKRGWPASAPQVIAKVEALVIREERLLEVAAGDDTARGIADLLQLADLASLTRRWDLAAGWFEKALDSEPAAASSAERWGVRAAQAAVQSAVVADSRPSSTLDATRRRRRALAWLEDELRFRRGAASAEDAGAAARNREELRRLLVDPLLAPVRDQAPPSFEAPEEAAKWADYWRRVREAANGN